MSLPAERTSFQSSAGFALCEDDFLSSIPLPVQPPPSSTAITAATDLTTSTSSVAKNHGEAYSPDAPTEEDDEGAPAPTPWMPVVDCAPTTTTTPKSMWAPLNLVTNRLVSPRIPANGPGHVALTKWAPLDSIPASSVSVTAFTSPWTPLNSGGTTTTTPSNSPITHLPKEAISTLPKSRWSPLDGVAILGTPPAQAATESIVNDTLSSNCVATPITAAVTPPKRGSRWDSSSPGTKKTSPGTNGVGPSKVVLDRIQSPGKLQAPLVVIAKGVRKSAVSVVGAAPIIGGANNMGFRIAYGSAAKLGLGTGMADSSGGFANKNRLPAFPIAINCVQLDNFSFAPVPPPPLVATLPFPSVLSQPVPTAPVLSLSPLLPIAPTVTPQSVPTVVPTVSSSPTVIQPVSPVPAPPVSPVPAPPVSPVPAPPVNPLPAITVSPSSTLPSLLHPSTSPPQHKHTPHLSEPTSLTAGKVCLSRFSDSAVANGCSPKMFRQVSVTLERLPDRLPDGNHLVIGEMDRVTINGVAANDGASDVVKPAPLFGVEVESAPLVNGLCSRVQFTGEVDSALSSDQLDAIPDDVVVPPVVTECRPVHSDQVHSGTTAESDTIVVENKTNERVRSPPLTNEDSSCSSSISKTAVEPKDEETSVTGKCEEGEEPPPPPPPPPKSGGRRKRGGGRMTPDEVVSPSGSLSDSQDDGGRRRSSRIRSMEARRERELATKPSTPRQRKGGGIKAKVIIAKDETPITNDTSVNEIASVEHVPEKQPADTVDPTTEPSTPLQLQPPPPPPPPEPERPMTYSTALETHMIPLPPLPAPGHQQHRSDPTGVDHQQQQEQFAVPLAPPATSPCSAGAFAALLASGDDMANRPEKVKSRWRRSSEMEVMSVVSVGGGGFVPPPCGNSNESIGTPPRGRSPALYSSASFPQLPHPTWTHPPPPPPEPPSVTSSPAPSTSDVSSVSSFRSDPAPATPASLPPAFAGLSIAPSGFFMPGEITEDWSEQDEVVASLAQNPLPLRLRVVQQQHHQHSSGSDSGDSPGSRSHRRDRSRNKDREREREKEKEIPKEPKPPYLNYEEITENIYLCDSKREVGRLPCYCQIPEDDEIDMGELACGSSCINRQLMMECDSRCPTGELCTNRRFQKKEWSKVEPVKTERKGWGLNALEDMPSGTFVLEYVGEVVNNEGFNRRVDRYSNENQKHYYFMALKSRQIIDATQKGNMSRFINHSCDPSCVTQKWTVNEELRVGFFTSRDVKAGEELTFDYQFQRYGEEAQKCFCDAPNCRGFIGGDKQTPLRKDNKRDVKKKRRREAMEDVDLEEEIEKFSQLGGLKNRHQTLNLCRLMVRVEDSESRMILLKNLQKTDEPSCLRLFLDYHGLSLMWSWMVDQGPGDETIPLKKEILSTLARLPITNRTVLADSKVMPMVQKWADQLRERAHKKPRLDEPAPPPPPSLPNKPETNSSAPTSRRSSIDVPPITAGEQLSRVAVLSSRRTRSSRANVVPSSQEEEEDWDVEMRIEQTMRDVLSRSEEESEACAEDSKVMLSMDGQTDESWIVVDACGDTDAKEASCSSSSETDTKANDKATVAENEDSVTGKDKLISTINEDFTNVSKDEDMDTTTTKGDDVISTPKDDGMNTTTNSDDIVGTSKDEEDSMAASVVKEETPVEGEMEVAMTLLATDVTREIETTAADEPSVLQDTSPVEFKVEAAAAVVVDEIDTADIANVANLLLESWSGLKDAYRIPRREQILIKTANEMEADKRERELRSEERDGRERRREHRHHRSSERSNRDRDSERGGGSSSSRDDRRDERRSDRHRRTSEDRERDRDRDRRSHDHSSSRDGHRGERSRSRRSRDKSPVRKDRRNRDPRSSANRTHERSLSDEEVTTNSKRLILLPNPMSKHERRHLFELQVHEEDNMRRQQEEQDEFYRQQEQHMQESVAAMPHLDPVTAAAYYDPNGYAAAMGQPHYYDPNTGYPVGPIPMPGEIQMCHDPVIMPHPDMTQHPMMPHPDMSQHHMMPHPDMTQHPMMPHPDMTQHPMMPHPDMTQHPMMPHPDMTQHPMMPHPDMTQHPMMSHPDMSQHPMLGHPDMTHMTHPEMAHHPMLGGHPDVVNAEPGQPPSGIPLPNPGMGPPIMGHPLAGIGTSSSVSTPDTSSHGNPTTASSTVEPSDESPVTSFAGSIIAATNHLTPAFDSAAVASGAPAATLYPVYSQSTPSASQQQQPNYMSTPPGAGLHYVAPPAVQTVFYTTPQGVVVQLPATDQSQWPQVVAAAASIVAETPPPPETPKPPKPGKLPPNWKTAKDAEGNVYFYHTVTRQTQWEPPTAPAAAATSATATNDSQHDMDLGTPTYDEMKSSKKKSSSNQNPLDDSELVRRTKELFRTKMSQFIVHCLNPYRKPDCKLGRISSTEEFKHLARKLTHFVMAKELKHCRNVEDLECNENVKHKSKDFVRKYMAKFGPIYKKTASPKDEDDE